MIKLEKITKSFGGQKLFKDLSFAVNKGEKLGLVGRNGHGKTTLFKIILGEIESDSGQVVIPKNYSIGYLSQHLKFRHSTVLEEVTSTHEEWKAKKILTGLGFSDSDFLKAPEIFSGGYQLRINLAKVLLSEPDLLMLDEPNNYLDIVAIRWLEKFLNSWQGEILVITHDRNFMDAIISHTVCIHRQKAKKIRGNTAKLYEQIDQEEYIYEKTRLNEQKKRKQTEEFITKFRAKARLGGMVQSRIKSLEKQESKDKLENISKLNFSFNFAYFNASQMMAVDDLSFGYESNLQLIKKFSINIGKNERVAIIGKNGKGKSTLLKLLALELKGTSGTIKKHDNVRQGYFGQTNIKTLNDEKNVVAELLASEPDSDLQHARNVSGNLMFSGDLALKKIKVLSGGEKSRVMLGKILLASHNLLFLDEPTNHLDMDSTEALLDAIMKFEGSTLMVTHNEEYLSRFADRLIVFDNGEVSVFNGSYAEFIETRGFSDELEIKKKQKLNKKEDRKKRAKVLSEKAKLLRPIKKKIDENEALTIQLEQEIKELNQKLVEASLNGDALVIKRATIELDEKKKLIDIIYDELEQLYEKQEAYI
ncbi:MAG: ABC-F family ATP-binding cassette domain-containing protein [bacterium]|nr:ABC-F family ATP-binding cassette domain-containing protein [bacterium]